MYSWGGKRRVCKKLPDLKRSPKKYKNPSPPENNPTNMAQRAIARFSKKIRPNEYSNAISIRLKTTPGITNELLRVAPRL